MEDVTRSKNRLNLTKNDGVEAVGGAAGDPSQGSYIWTFKNDNYDASKKALIQPSISKLVFPIDYPKTPSREQQVYLKGVWDRFEAALFSTSMSPAEFLVSKTKKEHRKERERTEKRNLSTQPIITLFQLTITPIYLPMHIHI